MKKTEIETIHSGSHIKKIISKGSWYMTASLFTKLLAFFILPITTRILSEREIGILDSIYSIRNLMPFFISLCLDEAYYRFYFNHNSSKTELKKYISTYFWIIILWGLFVVSVFLFISFIYFQNLFKVKFYPLLFYPLIGPLLLQLSLIARTYLKQNLKAEYISISEIISYLVFYSVFLFFLIVPKFGMKSKIYAWIIQDILFFIIFSFIFIKHKILGFKFDIKILIEGLKYSIPLLPDKMSYWITGLSDRIILGIFKTFSSTGIYSIGYIFGQSLTLFSENIFKVYRPIMYSMLTNEKEKAVKKIEQFIPAFFFIMFWIAFCISILSKEAIILFAAKKFYYAYIVVPIIAYAYLLGTVYKIFYIILTYHKKTWILSLGAIIQAGSNLICNIIFIPIFDRMAAAWTTFFSYLIFFIWSYLWCMKYEKIKIDWIKILYTIFTGLSAFLAIKLLLYIIPINTIEIFDTLFLNNFLHSILSGSIKLFFIVLSIFILIKFKLIDLSFFKSE